MNKENKKETVCAVVVTYNRKNLLLECLEAIRRQTRPVDGVYIIDNASDDGTPELLKEKGYIPELPPFNISEPYEIEHRISNLVDGNPINVFYVRMHKNTGGAGGFYEGVKRGYERGYDWLWLMDDDAEPKINTLQELLNDALLFKSYAICPLIKSNEGITQYYHHKKFNFLGMEKYFVKNNSPEKSVIYEEANAFVGPLISKNVVREIGFPMKELFIWGDDVEYTLRISKKFKLYLSLKANILHKDNNYAFNSKLPREQYWKVYFITRNRIIIAYKYFNIFSVILYILRPLFSFLKLRNFNYELFRIKLKGVKDGIKWIYQYMFSKDIKIRSLYK